MIPKNHSSGFLKSAGSFLKNGVSETPYRFPAMQFKSGFCFFKR